MAGCGARRWRAQIANSAAVMPPRSRSATRQRLQLLLGDDLMVLFAAACAGRSRRLHTLSAKFAMLSALVMAVPKALPKTTKIILEVRHGCRDRPSRLSSELRRLCSLPLPEAHYFFVMCNHRRATSWTSLFAYGLPRTATWTSQLCRRASRCVGAASLPYGCMAREV